jgi:hypothetical protein
MYMNMQGLGTNIRSSIAGCLGGRVVCMSDMFQYLVLFFVYILEIPDRGNQCPGAELMNPCSVSNIEKLGIRLWYSSCKQ